jgi:hypothetical protein
MSNMSAPSQQQQLQLQQQEQGQASIDSLLRQLFPDPDSVLIYDPSYTGEIKIPDLLDRHEGHFSSKRVAILFQPGTYRNVNCPVGYWTHIVGLGRRPSEVQFTGPLGVYALPANTDNPDVGSLDTFWRCGENFTSECEFVLHEGQYCIPLLDGRLYPVGDLTKAGYPSKEIPGFDARYGMVWACSQAAPLRRVSVMGNLHLSLGDHCASGGFVSNTCVEGYLMFGSQQQYCVRNTVAKKASNGAWSFVIVGSRNSSEMTAKTTTDQQNPQSTTSTNRIEWVKKQPNDDSLPNISYQTTTPVQIEKPYIYIHDDKLYLAIPTARRNTIGVDHAEADLAVQITTSADCKVKVFTPTSKFDDIQNALDENCHIILNPGIYSWDQTLVIGRANIVILGIGMATIEAPTKGPCIYVKGQGRGVRISGLSLEAASRNDYAGSTLLRWGDDEHHESSSGTKGDDDGVDNNNPGCIHDLYCFVGGRSLDRSCQVETMVKIYSNNVIGDNLWLWRADHCALRENEKPNKPHLSEYHVTEYG